MALSAAERTRAYRARIKDPSLRPVPRDLAAPKACKTCGATKALSDFRRSGITRDGYGAHCLSCSRAQTREYKAIAKQRDPMAVRAQEALDARRWRARNPELARARGLEAGRKWRLADPARKNAATRAWYAANLDHARAIKRKSSLNRHSKKLLAFVEEIDPLVVFERDGGVCGICGGSVSRLERWHVDHVMPLSRGGQHAYDNVQLAHAHCNISKGARLPLRKAGKEL